MNNFMAKEEEEKHKLEMRTSFHENRPESGCHSKPKIKAYSKKYYQYVYDNSNNFLLMVYCRMKIGDL